MESERVILIRRTTVCMLIAVAYVRSGPFHSLTSRMNAFLYSLLISSSHGSVFATHHEFERAGWGGWVRGISCI